MTRSTAGHSSLCGPVAFTQEPSARVPPHWSCQSWDSSGLQHWRWSGDRSPSPEEAGQAFNWKTEDRQVTQLLLLVLNGNKHKLIKTKTNHRLCFRLLRNDLTESFGVAKSRQERERSGLICRHKLLELGWLHNVTIFELYSVSDTAVLSHTSVNGGYKTIMHLQILVSHIQLSVIWCGITADQLLPQGAVHRWQTWCQHYVWLSVWEWQTLFACGGNGGIDLTKL